MASHDPVGSYGGPKMNEISRAINHLGFQLYKTLASDKENVFFSPLSISSALAMVFCGAKNQTSEEMRHVLGYEIANLPDEKVKGCFQQLLSALDKATDTYTLTSANVVLSQCNFPVKEEFKNLLKECFKAMTLEVDFCKESEKAVQLANHWVKENTNGMIPQLLDTLDPDTVMVILNAVYFKGFWMHQFKEKSTYLQYFYNKGLEVNAKHIDMMHLKESFYFAEQETFKALQLPYKGDEIAMLILLPNSRDGIEELESTLSPVTIQELKPLLRKCKIEVALPKFRLEYSKSLKQQFQSLGMNRVFCPGAHFGGISELQDLLISEIVHKAVLIINEEGTEAAAATAVIMMRKCLRFDPEFIVDHPFIFFIYNLKSDLIYFMGRVDEL